jgi:glycosyltransferase involved in cell wall biosynthesis
LWNFIPAKKEKMEAKKIVISTSPRGKSIPNHMFVLAQALQKKGHSVTLIIDQKYAGPTDILGVKCLTWPSDKPKFFKDASFFLSLCIKQRPDVVLGQFTSVIPMVFISWLTGVKNRWIFMHTMLGQLKHDMKSATFLRKTNRMKWFINKFATQVLANSEETKQDGFLNYKLPLSKISVFNYLLPDANLYIDLPLKEGRKHQVLFVSRLDKSKGHALVVSQIPAIIKKFPLLKFIFIGKGSEKSALDQQIKELNLTKVVQIIGFLKLAEVYAHMCESLIHISASKAEAFGLVNAEALSCATPIMAPEVGGIKEIMQDGTNGFFYNPEKSGELKQGISKILDNWLPLSLAARSSFITKFSSNRKETVDNQTCKFEALIIE